MTAITSGDQVLTSACVVEQIESTGGPRRTTFTGQDTNPVHCAGWRHATPAERWKVCGTFCAHVPVFRMLESRHRCTIWSDGVPPTVLNRLVFLSESPDRIWLSLRMVLSFLPSIGLNGRLLHSCCLGLNSSTCFLLFSRRISLYLDWSFRLSLVASFSLFPYVFGVLDPFSAVRSFPISITAVTRPTWKANSRRDSLLFFLSFLSLVPPLLPPLDY